VRLISPRSEGFGLEKAELFSVRLLFQSMLKLPPPHGSCCCAETMAWKLSLVSLSVAPERKLLTGLLLLLVTRVVVKSGVQADRTWLIARSWTWGSSRWTWRFRFCSSASCTASATDSRLTGPGACAASACAGAACCSDWADTGTARASVTAEEAAKMRNLVRPI